MFLIFSDNEIQRQGVSLTDLFGEDFLCTTNVLGTAGKTNLSSLDLFNEVYMSKSFLLSYTNFVDLLVVLF